MHWTLKSRSYHSPPYRIEPGIRGWTVWIDAPDQFKRLSNEPIDSLRAAKSFASHHKEMSSGNRLAG